MPPLLLDWAVCGDDGHWCSLAHLDLSDELDGAAGVYVIFYLGQGEPGRVVRIGQGNIAQRLAKHRTDPAVQAYRDHDLKVTWARVHGAQQGGVEAYLADLLDPLVGERFPDRERIAVNTPFG